ncbi:FecR family protein [Spirosoma fluminis]
MADDYPQPIDDRLLGKYLAGETDAAESERVRLWLSQSDASADETNQREFERFERIWETTAQLKQPAQQQAAPVDADAAWRKMRSRMQAGSAIPIAPPPPASPEAPVPTVQEPVIKPLHPTQPTDSRWFPRYWQVAATILLVSVLGWLLVQNQYTEPVAQLSVASANQTLVKALPDGSKVWLKKGSRLNYPQTFADDSRDVTLTGEAFFEVVPNPTKPFRIQAAQTTVQVLGTSFSVRAYENDVRVAVRTGKVLFTAKRKQVTLVKNELATFDSKADTIRKTLRAEPNLFAYRTGQLVFSKARLADIVGTVNDVYQADVRLADERLANCLLTVRFDNNEPLDTVLNVIAESLGLQVRRDGEQVLLNGEGCPE